MKKVFLLLAIVATFATSCKKDPYSFIKKDFKEYVKGNFNDPKSFCEFVSIKKADVASGDSLWQNTIAPLKEVLQKDKAIEKLALQICPSYSKILSNEKYYKEAIKTFKVYEVKIRVKVDGEKEIKMYNVCYYQGELYKIVEGGALMSDLPDEFKLLIDLPQELELLKDYIQYVRN